MIESLFFAFSSFWKPDEFYGSWSTPIKKAKDGQSILSHIALFWYWLSCPFPPFLDNPCEHTVPIQIIQDNLSILNLVE